MYKFFLFFLLLSLYGEIFAQSKIQGRIANWEDNKRAAVSITFDDWSIGHYERAIPELNRRNMPGTFYAVIDYIGSKWNNVLNGVSSGHEIGSHTATHCCKGGIPSNSYSTEVLGAKTTFEKNGVKINTFCYPYGAAYDNSELNNYIRESGHIAARSCQGPDKKSNSYDFATTEIDYYRLTTACIENYYTQVKTNNTQAQFLELTPSDIVKYTKLITDVISGGGLLTFTYHGIADNEFAWANLPMDVFNQYLDILEGYRKDLWITTVANAVKYHRQIKSGALLEEVVAPANGRWIVKLTHGLNDKETYNHPLTIMLKMNEVNYEKVTQNGNSLQFTKLGNDTIMIKAIPNGENITLEAGGAVMTFPSAPSSFTATAGAEQVVLTWTTPSNGGSPITKYQVSYGVSSNYTTNWVDISNSGAITTTHTVMGLVNGSGYTFEVRAVNAIGNGASSGTRMATPVTTPAIPDGFTATSGAGQVVLTWTTPSNGGSPIIKYQVSHGLSTGYIADWVDIPSSDATTTTYTISGLTNGTNYTFEVRAVNAIGNGASSGTRTVTPAKTPAVPNEFTATAGTERVVLKWTTPNNGGSPITKYQVSYGVSSGYMTDWVDIPSSNATTTTYTVLGLTNGTGYTFEVRAVNVIGNGASSGTRTATPATTPAILNGFTASSGAEQVVLKWTTPSNGGSPIIKYQVSYGLSTGYITDWVDIPSSDATTTTYTLSGLTNGTNYTFEVRAVNAIGNGASSGTRTATPATTPSIPNGFTATSGAGQVVLTWTTPSNGGSPIAKYQVSHGVSSGYMTDWVDIPSSNATTTTCTISGLTNGTNYTFEVRAVNAIGNGASSGTRTATPSTTPANPNGFTATSGAGQVVLKWTTPSNGGSPITKYQVSYGVSSGYTTDWVDISNSGATTTTHTVMGLVDGTGYTFEVRAVNAIGNGASSGTQTAMPMAKKTFVAVAGITGVPDIVKAGEAFTIFSTVEPADATNRDILWSIVSAGSTQATINGSTFHAPIAGIATICATIAGGVDEDKDYRQEFTITVHAITGFEIAEHPLVRTYPNPTTDAFYLSFDSPVEYSLILSDLAGKVVLRLTTAESITRIDISHLPQGVYLLVIMKGDKKSTIRIVKN